MKRLIMICLLLCVIYLAVVTIAGYPLVIVRSSQAANTSLVVTPGDSIKPFQSFDFSQGVWTAYLIFNSPDNALKGRVFKTEDKVLLTRIKMTWKFAKAQGDMTTAEGEILIYHDGELQFKSGIILDDSLQGLQSAQFGWMEDRPGGNMLAACRQFQKVNFPIVILR